ncbi:MAG: ornithine carbamoyltransferase [Eggerthellaceae bacterium]|jgi:ornithine carbamoyltransferase|nr:ornithine carbamoyltransferase [Eggerthellaceae bacterium]
MTTSLSGRNFLKLLDFTSEEILSLVDLAQELKEKKHAGILHKELEGKNIVLLFEKTSTRTRCSFEVAGHDLGMGVTYLDPAGSQMGNKESIEDTARVLGRMFDGIEYRGFGQEIVDTLAEYAGVPVWNGLTNECHPTQTIADLLTIRENFGSFKGLKLVFMGDAKNNVANSLMVGCAKMGINYVACAPESSMPDPELVATCQEIAKENGCEIIVTSDVEQGTKDANILYTDIWVSMGEPASLWEQRIKELSPYQINAQVMENAADNAILMHCLPAFHDTHTTVAQEIEKKFGLTEMEVTNEVFESEASKVFDEAENRMHAIKAIVLATLR